MKIIHFASSVEPVGGRGEGMAGGGGGGGLIMSHLIWSRGYKTFFMLNSVQNGILSAHKYKNIKKFSFFKAQISLYAIFPAH